MLKRLINRMIYSPTLMSWTEQVTIVVHGLVITSIILVKFDDLSYSFWMTLKVLVDFALLADAGFGHTLERSVAFFYSGSKKLPKNIKDYENSEESEGEPNVERLYALLCTSRGIYLFLSLLTIILLGTVGTLTLWNLLDMSHQSREFWLTYLLMIVQSFFLIQSLKWRSFVKGIRQVALYSRFLTILGVFKIFGFLVLLMNNLGMLYLQIYLVAETIFATVYLRNYIAGWFRQNGLHIGSSFRIDSEIFKSLWSVSWKSGLNTVGYYFTRRGIGLLTAQLKNTSLMSGFFFTYQILGFIRNFAHTPVYAHYPEYYGMIAVKKFREFKKDARVRLFLMFIIILAGFASFGLLGNYLLGLIGTDKHLVNFTIYMILSVYLFLDLHALVHGTIYISTNDVPFLIPGLLTGLATVVIGYFMLPHFGLLGLVLVQFLTNLMCNAWFSTYLSLRLTKWKLNDYFYDVFIGGTKYWIERTKGYIKSIIRYQ
jgi:O-antigen/teichoic acid export membrane protein